MVRGKFITLEGSEGAGKSTALQLLQSSLEQSGIDFVLTREPGGTEISEKIRELLLDKTHNNMCDDAELLLMFAARAQHIQELIAPSLAKGIWVICDRFTDATYAYQGGGRGVGEQRIAQLEEFVQKELRPDLTLLLDVPVEVGLQRTRERAVADRFETEQIGFFERVRNTYLVRANKYNEQFRVIDAGKPLEEVQAKIEQVMLEYISRHKSSH